MVLLGFPYEIILRTTRMQPLTPKDLMIRPKNEGDESTASAQPPVSLERFQVLERTIRDIPLYIDSYLELAEIYSNVGRWSDARRVLEIAVHRFPDDVNAANLYEDAQLARSQELVTKAEEEHRSSGESISSQNATGPNAFGADDSAV
jgi:tetratricopeptide (TPR) repeat protein